MYLCHSDILSLCVLCVTSGSHGVGMVQVKALSHSVPPLPGKKLFGARSPEFLEQRRSALDKYLKSLVATPEGRSRHGRVWLGFALACC